jgi:hypothetical protein
MELLAKILALHSTSAPISYWICSAVCSLVVDSPNNINNFTYAGGCEAIVEALKAHISTASVVAVGCVAIFNLSFSPVSKLRFIKYSTIDVLRNIIAIHSVRESERSCSFPLTILSEFRVTESQSESSLSHQQELEKREHARAEVQAQASMGELCEECAPPSSTSSSMAIHKPVVPLWFKISSDYYHSWASNFPPAPSASGAVEEAIRALRMLESCGSKTSICSLS